MFISFLFELLRDYFIYQQSYHYCDMHILRKYTEAKDNNINNPVKLGTGKSIFKNELFQDLLLMNENITSDGLERVCKSITEFYSKIYIEYNNENKFLLNIPRNFNNKNYQTILDKISYNKYEIITLNKSNQPECLNDLKCYINSRNIINYQDLLIKILKFDEFTNKNLNKMTE
jgi:hypothetical protein